MSWTLQQHADYVRWQLAQRNSIRAWRAYLDASEAESAAWRALAQHWKTADGLPAITQTAPMKGST